MRVTLRGIKKLHRVPQRGTEIHRVLGWKGLFVENTLRRPKKLHRVPQRDTEIHRVLGWKGLFVEITQSDDC